MAATPSIAIAGGVLDGAGPGAAVGEPAGGLEKALSEYEQALLPRGAATARTAAGCLVELFQSGALQERVKGFAACQTEQTATAQTGAKAGAGAEGR